MLSLNLLPPDEKNFLASRAAIKRILIGGASFLFLVFVFFSFLGSIWLYLEIQLNSAEEILFETENGQRGQAYHALREQIGEANKKLQEISNTQAKLKAYLPAFEALADLAPKSGLNFSRISLYQNILSLEGRADSRDILIYFKENLEKSPCFKAVENPVSNLLKQNNIDFSFKMQIN